MKYSGLAAHGLAVIAALWVTFDCAQADTLISLNAPVSVIATDPDPNAGYNNGTQNNYTKITNGTVLPNATGYSTSTATNQAVEWNGDGYVFEIKLPGQFLISSLFVDADDNDTYQLNYLTAQNKWVALYTAPIVSEGEGIRVRTDILSAPVTTSAVEIFGTTPSYDNYCYDGTCNQGGYAVAQVELFGHVAAVPEPSTWGMLLLGFAGVGFIACCRKVKPSLMAV